MTRSKLKQITLSLLATASIASAWAAEPAADAFSACAKEPDDARRLACYDRASGRTAAPAEKPVAPTGEVPVADSFGVAGSAVARRRADEKQQEAAAEEKPRSISAQVSEVSSRPRGELVVTLDNGQVWVQKDPQTFPIKPGDRVTINSGMLGSFRMINGRRATAVTRLK